MWQWIKKFIVNLFSLNKFAAASLPPAQDETPSEDTTIEVKLIPNKYSKEQHAFQDSISKIHKEAGFSEADLNASVNDFFENQLPKEYQKAFNAGKKDIIITQYGAFKGNGKLFTKAFPILRDKLFELGIKDFQFFYGSILIVTNSITKASDGWTSDNFTITSGGKQPPKLKKYNK